MSVQMEPIKVFRHGKGTFSEWRFEDGQSHGRILNPGDGVFLDMLFTSAAQARAFCERELEKDASRIFYVVQGDDIIDAVQDDAYHIASSRKENRLFAAVSLLAVMLIASVVSFVFMPFQLIIYDALFMIAMGAFYLLQYAIAGRWNLEGVIVVIYLLIILSVAVPLISR